MSGIFDLITSQVGGDILRQVSQGMGGDEGKTNDALQSAIPLLLGAMNRNAQQPEGARALASALERDHDGSILDDLSGYASNPGAGNGAGILKHLLGGQRGSVEQGLSQSSGLDAGSVGKLLEFAAPLIMGAVGKQQRSGGLDVSALADLLGREGASARQRAPSTGQSLLTQFLDRDGDGSAVDDVAKAGMGFFSRFFGRRR
ncbi:MAG: DUF937 domain-containing protein [Acidobacteriota bacterium]